MLFTMFSSKVVIWSVILGIGLFQLHHVVNNNYFGCCRLKQYTSIGSSLLVMMIVGGR
ncbi:MAG: hypothetical protein H6558_05595 [Lewinellaceae bacterium]|nr:hypothetical protein [Lewinellaceae bacterium]